MEIGKREMKMAIKHSKRKEKEELVITAIFTLVVIATLIVVL